MKVITLALFFFLSIKGCNDQEKEDSLQSLFNTKYSVESINGKQLHKKAVYFTIVSNRKITGYTGCNNFSADIMIKDDQIVISRIIATERYCLDTSQIERTFLSSISGISTIELLDNKLILYNENKIERLVAIKQQKM